MKFHIEIRHPSDPDTYRERTICAPLTDEHRRQITKQDRRIHLELLARKKRARDRVFNP